jgi:ribosomal protein S18 acetylase RimI-like enzyme
MKNSFGVVIADLYKKEHSAALVRLLDEYARGNTGTGKPLSARIKAKLVAGLKHQPMARIYLAKFNKKIVAVAVCFAGYSTFAAAPLINIHDLIVTKKFRRKGVASAMIEYIANEATAKNFCKVTLEVRLDNVSALELYHSQGFGFSSEPMYFMTKPLGRV